MGTFADQVRYERDGGTAVVTIDRPERRNAVDGPTADALQAAFERFEADPEARVLVLTGAGGEAFCAGADLQAIDSLAPRVDSPDGPMGFTRRIPSKPTIAAIDGWCVAGGFELALWCDLRIATGRSRFGCLERRWGVPLIDGGTQRLPRIVGLGRALDLILTGRVADAVEAQAMGLLTQVVEEGSALPQALDLAEALAAFPQETMLADRRAAIEGSGLPLTDGLELEREIGRTTVASGVAGAARFAGGAGRGGSAAGAVADQRRLR
jgi:enoyl-CoA hydratase